MTEQRKRATTVKGVAKSVPSDKAAQDFVATHRETDDAGSEVFGITELAAELGISPRAIRFYEDKDLLKPRRINGGRAYTRRDKVRLSLILRGKAMGMSLAEIKHILDLYGDRGEGKIKQLEFLLGLLDTSISELEERRAHIDTTLSELQVIRANLAADMTRKRRSAGT